MSAVTTSTTKRRTGRRDRKGDVSGHAGYNRFIAVAAYRLSDAGRRISRATLRHAGVRATDATIDHVVRGLALRKLIDRALVVDAAPEATDLKAECRRLVGEYRRAWRRMKGGGA